MTESQNETFRAALKEARAAFDRATRRLTDISLEKFELDNEVVRLRRTITALAAMCSESPWTDELGITETCTEVMQSEKGEVSTQEVVKKLERLGFDLASQKNPAASVHAVLSRLAAQGKIEKITNEEKNGVVTWKGPNYAPPDDYAQSAEISDDDIPF
jgi:hypothetical protein